MTDQVLNVLLTAVSFILEHLYEFDMSEADRAELYETTRDINELIRQRQGGDDD